MTTEATTTEDTNRFVRGLGSVALAAVERACDILLASPSGDSTAVQILKGACTAEKAIRQARKRRRRR